MRIKIPASIEEATKTLGELGRLLTASKWERAAVVYAFTRLEDGPGQPSKSIRSNPNTLESLTEFAKRGIYGLTTDWAVRKYHQAWADAIEMGFAKPVNPGRLATLPDPKKHTFPPTRKPGTGYGSEEGLANTLTRAVEKHGEDVVGRAATFAAPKGVVKAVGTDPELASEVIDEVVANTPKRERQHREKGVPVIGMFDAMVLMVEIDKALTILPGLRDSDREAAEAFVSFLEQRAGIAREILNSQPVTDDDLIALLSQEKGA